MDWNEAIIKLGVIIQRKFDEIRRDIPSEELMLAAARSLESLPLAGKDIEVPSPSGRVNIDVNIISEVINSINKIHKARIIEVANSIGVVLDQGPKKDKAEILEDSEDFILIAVDVMRMRLAKEMVVKILTLGSIP